LHGAKEMPHRWRFSGVVLMVLGKA